MLDRPGERQLLAGARHADVEQPPLFRAVDVAARHGLAQERLGERQRISAVHAGEVVRSRAPTRKTTGNSRPFARWTVEDVHRVLVVLGLGGARIVAGLAQEREDDARTRSAGRAARGR
jgi:hypothetical protein